MQHLSLPSFAKINLGLYVTGKRGNGYHEIETLLQQVSIKDIIELQCTETPEISLTCDTTSVPSDATNLCVKAAELLRATTDVQQGVDMTLQKVIPSGAGLGGGSSNAAVVLLGLNRLWNLGLSVGQLRALGVRLGADVPFFIEGGTAIAEGIGENLTPIDADFGPYFVVIFPEVTISTQWAYSQVNLDLTKKEKKLKLTSFKNINFNKVEFFKSLNNEFEAIVFKKHPQLAAIKEALYGGGALFASMSGSGSAMYGVFDRYEQALETKDAFESYCTFLAQPVRWGYDQLNQFVGMDKTSTSL